MFPDEQEMYANLTALLDQQNAIITAKTAALTAISVSLATGADDVVSKSLGGIAGSTSFTYVSLNEKLNTLMAAEKTVGEAILAQKKLIATSYPYWEECLGY